LLSIVKTNSNISGLVENQNQYISVWIVIYGVSLLQTIAHKPKHSGTWKHSNSSEQVNFRI